MVAKAKSKKRKGVKPISGRAARAVTTARINKAASKLPKFGLTKTRKGKTTATTTKSEMKKEALRRRKK